MPLLELLAKEHMTVTFGDLIKQQQEAIRFFTAIGGKEKFDGNPDPFFAFLRPTIRITTKFNKCHACRLNPGKIDGAQLPNNQRVTTLQLICLIKM